MVGREQGAGSKDDFDRKWGLAGAALAGAAARAACDGAGCSVGDASMRAPPGATALVGGARIVIRAGGSLVRETVAVVIHPVAGLRGWLAGDANLLCSILTDDGALAPTSAAG